MAGPSKKDYQQRLDQMTEIFAEILGNAQDKVTNPAGGRCPYRSAKDICTAKFGCANRENPKDRGAEPICAHDGTMDFRGAWETRPESYQKTKEKVARVRQQAAEARKDNNDRGNRGDRGDRRAGMEGKRTKTTTLFDQADEQHLRLASSCGRYGDCHECIVIVKQGAEALAPRTEFEAFLGENDRLA